MCVPRCSEGGPPARGGRSSALGIASEVAAVSKGKDIILMMYNRRDLNYLFLCVSVDDTNPLLSCQFCKVRLGWINDDDILDQK